MYIMCRIYNVPGSPPPLFWHPFLVPSGVQYLHLRFRGLPLGPLRPSPDRVQVR